jgi:hypothetical protein
MARVVAEILQNGSDKKNEVALFRRFGVAATHMSRRQWANGAMICAIPNRHVRGRKGTWAMMEELSETIEGLARVEQVCQEVRL